MTRPSPRSRPRRRAAPGARRSPPAMRHRITAPRPLAWTSVAPRLRTAVVEGGLYALVSDGLANWTAEWRPSAGRVEFLLLRSTEQLAITACTHHHLTRHASEVLERDQRSDLTQRDTTGAPLAWRRGR